MKDVGISHLTTERAVDDVHAVAVNVAVVALHLDVMDDGFVRDRCNAFAVQQGLEGDAVVAAVHLEPFIEPADLISPRSAEDAEISKDHLEAHIDVERWSADGFRVVECAETEGGIVFEQLDTGDIIAGKNLGIVIEPDDELATAETEETIVAFDVAKSRLLWDY